jgi:hypothetical protein
MTTYLDHLTQILALRAATDAMYEAGRSHEAYSVLRNMVHELVEAAATPDELVESVSGVAAKALGADGLHIAAAAIVDAMNERPSLIEAVA